MPGKILIVEDDALQRRNVALFLHKAAYDVYQAENGERALELISIVPFDTVISDFRLDGKLNGIDVLKHQNERAAGKRLVLVTGFGSADVQAQAAALGAIYLEKPISLSNLLTTIGAYP